MAPSKPRSKRVFVLLIAAALSFSCGGEKELDGRDRSKAGGSPPAIASPAAAATPAETSAGRCNPAYSLTALPQKQFAFDGVVTEIGERADPQNPTARFGTAVFSINEWFKGGGATELTLQSALPRGEDTVPITEGPDLSIGSRYLVSGDGAFVGTCGFTRDWSRDEAAAWERAFNS